MKKRLLGEDFNLFICTPSEVEKISNQGILKLL